MPPKPFYRDVPDDQGGPVNRECPDCDSRMHDPFIEEAAQSGPPWMVTAGGFGGDEGTRTPYLSDANAALSQMSYVP